MRRLRAIAVCGSGTVALADPLWAMAEELGERIVRAGFALVCGGMGGVMEAAARGGAAAAASATAARAGVVVGILPGEGLDSGNPWCDIAIPTGIGIARNALVVRAADAVILVGGGSGTLSEAALAWQLGKPVIALTASGGWARRLAGEPIDERRADVVVAATSPRHAVELALTLLADRAG